MIGRNIAIASNILWNDSYKIRIHFFVEYFLRKCFSVSYFAHISLLSFLHFKELRSKFNRLRLCLKSLEIQIYKNNHSLICYSFLRIIHSRAKTPLLDSYFISKKYLNFTYPSIRKLANNNAFGVFIFDCLGIEVYPHVKANLTVYKLNDLVSTSNSWNSKGLANLEEEVLRKADMILTVSEPLFNRAVEKRGNSN